MKTPNNPKRTRLYQLAEETDRDISLRDPRVSELDELGLQMEELLRLVEQLYSTAHRPDGNVSRDASLTRTE
jgi:hypothetical protein